MRSDDYAELNNSFRAGSARNTLRSRRGAVWGHLHYHRRIQQWIYTYRQGLATQKRHDLGRAATPASLRSQGVRHCHAGILDLRPKQGGVGSVRASMHPIKFAPERVHRVSRDESKYPKCIRSIGKYAKFYNKNITFFPESHEKISD